MEIRISRIKTKTNEENCKNIASQKLKYNDDPFHHSSFDSNKSFERPRQMSVDDAENKYNSNNEFNCASEDIK